MKEVYTLLFTKYTPPPNEIVFAECWGVFNTKKSASIAFSKSYWELGFLYKATHTTFDEDFVHIETIDGEILELKIDTTTYYEEV